MADTSPSGNTAAEWELTWVLGNIRWYAKEYNLTAEQIKRVFEYGLVSAQTLNYIHIPTCQMNGASG
jgi:hypothetical protein